MSQRAEQFTCECGKQFSNRNDLDRHRQNCATAQSAQSSQRGGGQQGRGAGGSSTPGSGGGTPGSGNK